MAELISINVGLPRDFAWRGKNVYTGIWKSPVQGRSFVRRLNIDGDGQGDLAGHGGEHRAVMVYQLDSYRHWEHHLGRNDFTYGQFGENFTVQGLSDDEVCIGDRYRIGTALFEVTQPRVTCYRLGIRMNQPDMAALVVSHRRPGFYFRVLEEGSVGPGDEITKVVDGPEHVSIAEIDALLYLLGHPRDQLERALRIPALSAGWVGSLQALAAQGPETTEKGNPGLTGLTAPRPAWDGFRPLAVAHIEAETDTVRSFSFRSPDGVSLPPALPGQFLVLKLRPDTLAPALVRNYSMSGSPGADLYRVSVKREPEGRASTFLHTRVNAGDVLEVSAPRGNFTLRSGARPVVLVSAGVGATPVLAMLHMLSSTHDPREVWWIYGARSGADHPFANESRMLLTALPQSRTHITYSRPRTEDRIGIDYDEAGHVNVPMMYKLGVPQTAEFYVCGPPSFLEEITAGLLATGIPGAQIFTESFGPGASLTPGITGAAIRPVHAPEGDIGSGPQIAFARSGLTVRWSARFQSLLEIAEACDVPVKWSCRTGVCHTCESGLIGGAVEYLPDPLEPPAEGNVLICCSRPSEDVELDL